MSKDFEDEVLKLINRQSKLIYLITSQLSDCVFVVNDQFRKCVLCLKLPITVKHINVKSLEMCDHCAARSIIDAKSCLAKLSPSNDSEFSVNLEDYPPEYFNSLLDLSNEDKWVDIKNADKIRKISTFIELMNLKESYENDDPPLLH